MSEEFDQFNGVKDEMISFTSKVTENLTQKLTTLDELSIEYTQRDKALAREEDTLISKLNQLNIRNDELDQELARSNKENKDIKEQMARWESQTQNSQSQEESLKHDLDRVQLMLTKEKERHTKLKQKVVRRKMRKMTRVEIYEQLLGLTIESNKWGNNSSTTPPQVCFTFKNFDETDMNKTCSVVLETSPDETQSPFKIVGSVPALNEKEDYPLLIETLERPDGLRNFIILSRHLLIQRLSSQSSGSSGSSH